MMKHGMIICTLLLLVSCLNAAGKGDLLLSLAVPGYRQISDGRDIGYALLATEATLLGTMYYLAEESDLKYDESYSYAFKFAHLEPNDYDAFFMKNLGRYNSSGFDADGYNASVRKEAIRLYPYDPVQQQAYIDDHAYGDDQYWNWDSAINRARFNKMRNDAADLESYGKLAVGVLLMNHIVNAVDVLRSNRIRRTQVSVGMKRGNPQLRISYRF